MTRTTRPGRTRSIRLLTIGAAASGLCLAGAGLAAAAGAFTVSSAATVRSHASRALVTLRRADPTTPEPS